MLLFGERGNVYVDIRRIHQIKVSVQAFEMQVLSQGRAVIKGVHDYNEAHSQTVTVYGTVCLGLYRTGNLDISFPLPVHGTSLSKRLDR